MKLSRDFRKPTRITLLESDLLTPRAASYLEDLMDEGDPARVEAMIASFYGAAAEHAAEKARVRRCLGFDDPAAKAPQRTVIVRVACPHCGVLPTVG